MLKCPRGRDYDATKQVGLPFLSFVVIAWMGLQQGLKAKFQEGDRRKRYVEPETPEAILAVRRACRCCVYVMLCALASQPGR